MSTESIGKAFQAAQQENDRLRAKEQPGEQKWIPMSKRLPKNNDRCLYFDGEVDVARGWWIKGMANKITHWQPLPPPPERP